MKNQIIIHNYVPHSVEVINNKGQKIIFPLNPEGKTARCTFNTTQNGFLSGFPIIQNEYGEVTVSDANGNITEFPEQKEDVFYIVSALVANALKRSDCIIVANRRRNIDGTLGAATGFSFIN